MELRREQKNKIKIPIESRDLNIGGEVKSKFLEKFLLTASVLMA